MKYGLLVVVICAIIFSSYGQDERLRLENVVVVAQQDRLEDKYSLELAVIDVMQANNIRAKSSLNVVKQGEDPVILASEETQKILKADGFDTFMLISVRGYDKRFTPSTNLENMRDELSAGHLFRLWREDANSVSFTVIFYRNNIPVHYDLIRVTSTGSKSAVLKRLSKILNKKIQKEWK